jgi:hypothetical protein
MKLPKDAIVLDFDAALRTRKNQGMSLRRFIELSKENCKDATDSEREEFEVLRKNIIDTVRNIGDAIDRRYGKELMRDFVRYLNETDKKTYKRISEKSLDDALEFISGVRYGEKKQRQGDSELLVELVGLLSDLRFYQYLTCRYLKKQHGLKLDIANLHTLNPEIKQNAREYLKSILGNGLQAENIIKNVFRKPNKSKRKRYYPSDYF